MAKLECFSIAGVDLWFWPNDHEPPHFHAKRRGEWEVRVNFLEDGGTMFELVWAAKRKQMSRNDRATLEGLVREHRPAILKEWETKVSPK
jgi:Domain of unknown function (DUF4160)